MKSRKNSLRKLKILPITPRRGKSCLVRRKRISTYRRVSRIPYDTWGNYWRIKLQKELSEVTKNWQPKKMKIRLGSVLNEVDLMRLKSVMNIHYSLRATDPATVKGFPTLKYTWGSISGHFIDNLNFIAPFEIKVLRRCMSTLEGLGVKINDPWSLIVVLDD